jgi:hypothetical protein
MLSASLPMPKGVAIGDVRNPCIPLPIRHQGISHYAQIG